MSVYEQLATAPSNSQVSSQLANLKTWLSTQTDLDVDVDDPMLGSLLLGPIAELMTENEAILSAVATYGSLNRSAINAISDESLRKALRESLAATLGVEETPAGFAVGEVQITVSAERSVVVAAGSQFRVGAVVFQTTGSYVARPKDQLTNQSGERTLFPQRDSTWIFTIPVSAITAGAQANIEVGTAMSTDLVIADLVSIMAASNFVGGRDANTLQDLIDAVFANTAARTLGSRDQITAFVQNRAEIGNIRQVGVIGFGDPELSRDYHPFLPMQAGSKADVYLASEYYPSTQTVETSATVTDSGQGKDTLTIGLSRDVSPGYLRILDIIDSETGDAYTIESEIRGFDNTPIAGEQVPYLENATDASFSRFQTATVTISRATPEGAVVNSGENRQVQITFQRVPAIDVAQTLMSNRANRHTGGDILVRSAIPIFLDIRIRLISQFPTNVPATEDLTQAVTDEILRRPMRAKLYRSDVVQAISRYLPNDLAVGEIEYSGVLIKTDGSSHKLLSKDDFACPYSPMEQLTPRTVAMYTAPSKVNISLAQEATLVTP